MDTVVLDALNFEQKKTIPADGRAEFAQPE
jgi:hypothetical protein